MKVINEDLFSFVGQADVICITTNGYVNMQGLAVMGRGCAKEAKDRWPDLPKILAQKIAENGNVVNLLIQEQGTWIASFPVKPVILRSTSENEKKILPHLRVIYSGKNYIPGFAVYADLEIIERSARHLKELVDKQGFKKIVVPLAGTGAGELKPVDVMPIFKRYFDERFIVVDKPASNNQSFIKIPKQQLS